MSERNPSARSAGVSLARPFKAGGNDNKDWRRIATPEI